MDRSHLHFALESALQLRTTLQSLGGNLFVHVGSAIDALTDLSKLLTIGELVSHEETGGMWTYRRDQQVQRWCRTKNIPWTEFRQDGVVRRLPTRDLWASHWNQWVSKPLTAPPTKIILPEPLRSEQARQDCDRRWKQTHEFSKNVHSLSEKIGNVQVGGENRAHALLDSFLTHRGARYRSEMSSPISAEKSCSRLSPYLAWGCINVRQIYQRLEDAPKYSPWGASIHSYRSRLAWHCHFMQKLEDQPELESRNLCSAYDGLRENDFSDERFEAWCLGRTGHPMIDACMRYLHRHRWINFRMRAMLVSFASYDLWLHWQRPAEFLARNFLDFEPGIHYPQVQMQSGTTGINTIRIYSPEKQGKDQDPEGRFVKEYVPELRNVPIELLWTPWKMSLDEQSRYGCILGQDYPKPIVEHASAIQRAKDRIYAVRGSTEAQALASEVALKHASRKRRDPLPMPSSTSKKSAAKSTRSSRKKPSEQPFLPGFDTAPDSDDPARERYS
jgi:deoxyribodipyrimidine photo-lyase